MYTVASFAEFPPGVLGSATLVAFAIAALIATFTFTHSLPVHSLSGNQALPGLLLSFTTVGVSWLGLALGLAGEKASLLRASLTARFGLIANAVMALASALLYATYAARPDRLNRPKLHVSLLGGLVDNDYNTIWLILSLMSLLLFFWLVIVLSCRTYGYMYAAREAREHRA
jgi:hypothetical protein